MSDDLKPCPFCGGGITTIEGGGQIWRGVNGYSDPQFYHLRHFGKLSETDDFPRCFVEFRCRTEADAIPAVIAPQGVDANVRDYAIDVSEAYDTMMEVERNPNGAWQVIQALCGHIATLAPAQPAPSEWNAAIEAAANIANGYGSEACDPDMYRAILALMKGGAA